MFWRMSLEWRFLIAVTLALIAAYFLVFWVTSSDNPSKALHGALNNALTAAFLATIVHRLALVRVWTWQPWAQILALIPLAALFAITWYFAVVIGIGIRGAGFLQSFEVNSFRSVAFEWQIFQGTTLFALVAALSQILFLKAQLQLTMGDAVQPNDNIQTSAQALLVRHEGEVILLDPADVVRISGAGDYAEVVTATRTILSSGTLAEFEGKLSDTEFLRVHRSHLVRLGAVEKAEPAGNGRMTLHLAEWRYRVCQQKRRAPDPRSQPIRGRPIKRLAQCQFADHLCSLAENWMMAAKSR